MSMKLNLSEAQLIDYVNRISHEFYELVYQDEWFKKLFINVKQEFITSQQADFMIGSLGGPKNYGGRPPQDAHPHIWISEEIWKFREDLLIKAFNKVGAPQELLDAWLRVDEAFKSSIVNKGGPEECYGRYKIDPIIYEPMPSYKKVA